MQVDATVFTCISMLSRAMGPCIQQDIKELLEPMLTVGLRSVDYQIKKDAFFQITLLYAMHDSERSEDAKTILCLRQT